MRAPKLKPVIWISCCPSLLRTSFTCRMLKWLKLGVDDSGELTDVIGAPTQFSCKRPSFLTRLMSVETSPVVFKWKRRAHLFHDAIERRWKFAISEFLI